MAHTVAELLELIKPFGARLDAGAKGLHRQLTWVHCSDLPDVGLWLRGGEVVLNTALHIDGSGAASTLLQSLARGGASAVVFADDPMLLEPARRTLREMGDSLQLPVLYIPVAVKFVDVTQAISRSIISSQFETLRYWETVHERFIRSALEGRGTKQLVELLAEIMERRIALVDSQLRMVSSSGQNGSSPALETTDLIPAGSQHDKLWKDLVGRSEGLRAVPQLQAWVQPIRARGDLLGLLVIGGLEQVTELGRIAIDQAAIALALELLKERELRDLDGRLGFELLADILSGRTRDHEEAQRRAGFLGFDLTAPFRIAVIEEATRAGSSPSLAPLRRRKQRFLRAIDWALGPNPVRLIVMARSDALVLLGFEVPSTDGFRRFARTLISKLEAETPGSHFLGGISGVHQGAQEILPAYEEAARAREIGSRSQDEERITAFDEVGLQGLIVGLASKELLRIAEQRLSGLDGTGHSHELRQTVEAYLDNEGSISRTAARLGIHRNTVLQRLQRVKAVTGLDPQKIRDGTSLAILLTVDSLNRRS